MLEEEERAVLGALVRDLAHAVDETRPRLAVRRLERVVVALDAGPEDHLRSDLAGEAGCSKRLGERVCAHRVVGRREAAFAKARVEMRARTDRVDAMSAERLANLVEVLLGELLRIVKLVVVDQVAQPVDGARDSLDGRLARVLGLVATGDEPRDHRPEGPDAEARPRRCVSHARTLRRIAPVTSEEARRFALSLPEAVEQDHHGRPSFRVGAKIFATLWDEEHMNVMLDEGGIRTAVQALPTRARMSGGAGSSPRCASASLS